MFDALAALFDVEVVVGAIHHRGVDVSGAFAVWTGEEGHDGEEDLFDVLDGGPALRDLLVVCRVLRWRVEDGDADVAVCVDCG